ncbi:MAG: hypothetical protein CMJ49_08800, partial [Planctomycetaceae bacterium]|nr:hypothetical protein [Planctomycetaceae bacterium]
MISDAISKWRRQVRLATRGARGARRRPIDRVARAPEAEVLEPRILLTTTPVYVDDDFAGLSIGDDPAGPATSFGTDAFATIQEGIDGVDPGGTVFVADGNYNEDLSISKSLDLVGDKGDELAGEGALAPVLDGTALFGFGVTVTGAATSVLMEGFSLENWMVSGASVTTDGTFTLSHSTVLNGFLGIQADSGAANMVASIIDGSTVFGVNLINGGTADIDNSRITNGLVGVNAGTGTVDIDESVITGNAIGLLVNTTGFASVNFSDLSGNGTAVSSPINTVDASSNWWGTSVEASVVAATSGVVDFTPFLDVGTDTNTDGSLAGSAGFQGDFSTLHVTALGEQAGGAGRIEEAVGLADDPGTINIRDGLYVESNVTLDKELLIEGQSEAGVVIAPGAEDDNLDSATAGTVINGLVVEASDVQIKRLTLDGQANPALTAGKNNFRTAIITSFNTGSVYDDLEIEEVTINHVYRRGIQLFSGATSGPVTATSTGNLINDVTIDDVTANFAIAVFESDTDITNNTITNASAGIGTNFLQDASNAPLVMITGNQIDNVVEGINASGLAGGSVIGGAGSAANTIDLTQANGTTFDGGIIVQYAQGVVTVENNTIDASEGDTGILLFSNESAGVRVVVKDNVLTATLSDGATRGEGTGIFVTDEGDFFGDNDGASYAELTGNTITDFAKAIDIHGASDEATGVKAVNVTLDSNVISGAEIGVRVFERDGSADAGGDEGVADGYAVEVSIADDMSGITGTDTVIQIDNAQMSLTGKDITANTTGVHVTGSEGLLTLSSSDVSGADTGVLVDGGASATIINNPTSISGNTTGIHVSGGTALIENTNLTGNTTGVLIDSDATVDLGDVDGANVTGLGTGTGSNGSSAGNNVLTGYTGVTTFAIDNDNLDASGNIDVEAENNNFGSSVVSVIETVIDHTVDNAAQTEVFFIPTVLFPTPTIVFVDDSWAGTGLGVDPDGAGGALGDATAFGQDAFATIQDALAAVIGDGTGEIRIYDGLYLESNSLIDKPILIQGQSEAGVVIGPDAEDDNLDSATAGTVINGLVVASDDVRISTLTIDGEANGSLTPGKHNIRTGIITSFNTGSVYDNLDIQDVTIQNIFRRGIQLFSGATSGPATAKSTGNIINDVTIDDVTANFGIAVFESDTSITDSTITNAAAGIGTNYLQTSANAPLVTITGNDMDNVVEGINASGLAGGSVIGGPGAGDPNTIDLTQANGTTFDGGIIVQYAEGVVTVENNTVDASEGDTGILLFSNESAGVRVVVKDNILTATLSDGTTRGEGTSIFVTDEGDFFGDNDGASYAELTGNTITDFAKAIDIHGASDEATGVKAVNVTLDSNVISGAEIGVRVFERDGSADAGGDEGAPDGYAVEVSIADDMSGITGTDTVIQIDNAQMTLTGKDITANTTGVHVTGSEGLLTLSSSDITTGGTGVLVDGGASATIINNPSSITGNTTGVHVSGGKALIENTNLTGNTKGVLIDSDATVDLGDVDGANVTGLGTGTGTNGSSAGNNVLTGYDGTTTLAIDNDNLDVAGNIDVEAENNDFGSVVPAVIEVVVDHTVDDPAQTRVFFSGVPVVAPTIVFVDDDWDGTALGVDPDGAGGAALGNAVAFGLDAFANIQDALVAVSGGGSGEVRIYDGDYFESNSIVDKPILITGQTEAGVVIGPDAEDDNLDSATAGTVINGLVVESSDVRIRNLTIDGEANGSLTPGKHNIRTGIITSFDTGSVYDNLDIQDVTIQNIYRRGIQLFSGATSGPATAKSTGNLINDVTIDDVSVNFAIAVFESDTAITDSTITNAAAGIGTNYLQTPANAPLVTITGNQIDNVVEGINASGLAGGSVIGGSGAGDANTIDLTQANGTTFDGGIIVQYAEGVVTVEGNTIDASDGDTGILLFHNESAAVRVVVKDNILTATSSDGTTRGEGTGIFVTDEGDFFGDNDGASYAELTGNTITDFARGIDIHGASDAATGVKAVNVTLDSNVISGADIGVRVFERDGSADVGGDEGVPDGYAVEVTSSSDLSNISMAGVAVEVDNANFTTPASMSLSGHTTGIRLTGADGVLSMTGATLTGNTTGVVVDDGEAAISGGVLSGNTTGVEVSGGEATIDGSDLSGGTTGVQVNAGGTASILNADLTGGTTGVSVSGGTAKLQGNDLTGNTTGLFVESDGLVDAGNLGTDVTGLGASTGNNDFSGYTGTTLAIDNDNLDAAGNVDVLAQNNSFGTVLNSLIETVVDHTVDDALQTEVFFTPAILPPTPSIIFVDDNWVGLGLGDDPDGPFPGG